MKREQKLHFTISEMQLEDIEPATAMRLQSWLDTYVNEDLGVTADWIEKRNRMQLSEELKTSRRERFIKDKQSGILHAWVAKDADGKIIGSTTPFRDEDGTWQLGSLYVDKTWHGTGVGSELMRKVVDTLRGQDIYLGVVSYNERAKAFYRKWGFEVIPDSESLFDNKMPEIRMVRREKK